MFVVFRNSTMIACFEDKDNAVAYWRQNGGTIVFYPDLTSDNIHIEA